MHRAWQLQPNQQSPMHIEKDDRARNMDAHSAELVTSGVPLGGRQRAQVVQVVEHQFTQHLNTYEESINRIKL